MAVYDTTPKPRPLLRLVASNPNAFRPLMSLRELELRLAVIERRLHRPAGDQEIRTAQLRQRHLIAEILATRLLDPARARRLEQELRWLARADADAPPPSGSVFRFANWLRSLLSADTSSSVAA